MNECKCKGIRTCLLCERAGAVAAVWPKAEHTLYQCHRCGKLSVDAAPSREVSPLHTCSSSCAIVTTLAGKDVDFCGTLVVKDFLTEKEEQDLVTAFDASPWAGSQEGRRKQAR